MPDPVIIGGARTPVGRLLGSLAGFSGADLGGLAIKAAIERAGLAQKNGVLGEEIVAVQVPQGSSGGATSRSIIRTPRDSGKEPLTFADDEGIRVGTTVEALAKLPPAFGKEGTITAGSSSQIS